MQDVLARVLGVSLVIFMVGSLLDVGLMLRLGDSFRALKNRAFVAQSLLWAFVLCPAFAVLLTKIVPLAQPYAIGLVFLGMTPCAPFVPVMSRRAGGDLAYVAAFMVLTAVGTVVSMPVLTPLLVTGFSADAWTIARPLVYFVALPLAAGVVVRLASRAAAEKLQPVVKMLTTAATVVMLAIVLWKYGGDFVGAIGSFAIITQFVFYSVVAAGGYALSAGLTHGQRSVLALGVCTRNIGAAFAPLMAVKGIDQRAVAMVALAVPISVCCGLVAARLLGRRAPAGEADRAAV